MKYQKWIVAFLFIVVLIVMQRYGIAFHSYSGTKTLDMSFGYTSGELYHSLQLFGNRGRWQLIQYFCLDFIFIFFFAIIQIYILRFVMGEGLWRTKLRYLYIISLLRGIFDFIENVLFIVVITRFPIKYIGLVTIMSFITQMKFLLLGTWFIAVAVAGVARIAVKNKNY